MIAMMATKITTIATIVPVEMDFFRANGGAGVTVRSKVKKKVESEFHFKLNQIFLLHAYLGVTILNLK